MLQDIAERDNLTTTRIVAIPYDLIVGIVGRDDVAQRALLIRILHTELHQIEGIIDRETFGHVFEVERIIEHLIDVGFENVRFAHLEF